MPIGTSDGTQYEDQFDYVVNETPKGAGADLQLATREENQYQSGQPIYSPGPASDLFDTSLSIDKVLAAAGTLASGDPIIGQMQQTAERSRPQKFQSGGTSWDEGQIPEPMANPNKFIKNQESWSKMVNSWPKSTNIEDHTKDLENDANLRVFYAFKNMGIDPDDVKAKINDFMTKPIDELQSDIRNEAALKAYGKRRLREGNKGVRDTKYYAMSQSDETPDPISAWNQYAMMKTKDVPTNPGVEAEKIAGGTAWARGQPRLEVKSMSEYYDKVPMDVRLKSNGISHPGFRFQVQDKEGNSVGKEYTNSNRARGRVDKLDNEYGSYRYRKVMVPARNITDQEFEQMKKLGLIKPDAER